MTNEFNDFFGRIPTFTDRDSVALECRIRGKHGDRWLQLQRLPRGKLTRSKSLVFPTIADLSFGFADASSVGRATVVLVFDVCGQLAAVFWRRGRLHRWASRYDFSELIKAPVEIHPGCRLIFSDLDAAKRFSAKFLEVASDEFGASELHTLFDDVLEIRCPLPEKIFPSDGAVE